jgi:hypothetical protein
VPTARFSTSAFWRPVTDARALLRFRFGSVRRPRALRWALVLVLLLTVATAVVPAFVPRAGDSDQALQVAVVIPTAMAGFLLLSVVSGIASGGGRELISRDQAVAYPVSAATDHLGALIMAPLNIAWLLQAWALLGATAFAQGGSKLGYAQPLMVLWMVAATALGQLIAWTAEAVRRGPFGVGIMRGVLIGFGAVALGVQLAGHTADVLDRVPTQWILVSGLTGFGWRWVSAVALLLVIAVVSTVAGAWPARWASLRMPHDEQKIESGLREARPDPRFDWLGMLRLDRASVWRSVPIRRGMTVLAVGPGLVALFGDLTWPTMTILPGLVASGGALLFGVNVWCLDGRGGLWRENLPISPRTGFWVRALVIGEFLGFAALITIALASVRAGIPASQEAMALLCTVVVVLVQVVGAAMRWSGQHPYPSDLRSARATPAPPVVMVGYSARLALSTTITGMVFSGLAQVPQWWLSLVVALPCLCWSFGRLVRAADRWTDPARRSYVVTTVAA